MKNTIHFIAIILSIILIFIFVVFISSDAATLYVGQGEMCACMSSNNVNHGRTFMVRNTLSDLELNPITPVQEGICAI